MAVTSLLSSSDCICRFRLPLVLGALVALLLLFHLFLYAFSHVATRREALFFSRRSTHDLNLEMEG